MDSPSVNHSHGKKEGDGDVDWKSEKSGDHVEWESSDKKKHRSSKSRKQGSGDDAEDFDGSGRKRSSGDRYESRKRAGVSKQESDEDDHEARRETRSKQAKRKQEESALEKLSTWYQDGELENRPDGVDKLGSRGHGRGSDDSDKRKGKLSDHEVSQSKSRSKHHEIELEKVPEKDSKYSERRESKGHGSSENVKGSKRRLDDPETVNKVDEIIYDRTDEKGSKESDNKHDIVRERSGSSRNEHSDSKNEGIDSSSDKGVRSNRRDERRSDGERNRNRSVSVGVEEDEKASPSTRDDRTDKEKNEQQREQRTHSGSESRDRVSHADEDGRSWSRDRSVRGHRSTTPDRGSRYGRERSDSERTHGRSSRKSEALKISSSGYSNDNYDVIEIRTNPDYGKTESNNSKRYELGQQADGKTAPSDDEWKNTRDDRARYNAHGPPESSEGSKERYNDEDAPERDQKSWREDNDVQGSRGREQRGGTPLRTSSGQSSGGFQPPSNQDSGSLNRTPIPVIKGSRVGRGGRGRPSGRDNQQISIPLPIMGSPFGPLGIPPPGPLAPLNPTMSPAPGAAISPGVFVPQFSPQVVWPGARGIDVNMLGMPPALSPIPTGPAGPRFAPNMGTPNFNNPAAYFNQQDPGRGGVPSNVPPGSGFNEGGPMARGNPPEKTSGSWVPPRSGGPSNKAPSRGEQNDYSQNFVDTGMRPQNFIRELELTNVVEDYPKLRELIQKKDEIVANSASPPMYYKCDLREFELSPEFFGTKFDVILVDPPWEEYVHRAPGVADHLDYWTFEEILNLKIEAIADTPSFIFLWVGDGVGLEQGRQCLKKWGFRRCEDICWVKTNKTNATPGLRHDSNTLFQHSKEHCLMGIKGTVRRSTDGHIIHANIDTDVIIAEEPPYGSTQKPEDMYRIVEHFALGRRRLELFGEDHNIRSGWLTVGKGLSSSNFNSEAYTRSFSDKDGKVWQGGGGRNPPPDAPHLVLTTPEIESLRPKSPMKNQQQMQQNSSQNSISLTNPTSSNRRSGSNSQPNSAVLNIIPTAQEAPPSSGGPASWGPPPPVNMDGGGGMYGYGAPVVNNGEFMDFDPHRAMNL